MQQQDQYQQGDVILRRITKIPTTAVLKQHGGKIILAHGEVTGHHHAVEDADAELIAEGERMLLRITKTTQLTHQEHGPISLSPGLYEIGRVQEFDYISQITRPVQD